jgi:phage terminase large subunit
VILSSSSARQVKSINWREVVRLHGEARKRLPLPLGGTPAKDPETGVQLDGGREIVGISTDVAERIAGTSSPNLLYLLDEASGIPESIFEAMQGNLAGGGRLAMFSNPTKTSGFFYDAFHTQADYWHTISISSEETPNACGVGTPIPGLATAEFIAEKRTEWGVDSPLYQVRIAGNFPLQGSNAVIPLADVALAQERWRSTNASGQLPRDVLELGVDPARYGSDRAVVFPRRGRFALRPHVFRKLDHVPLALEVLRVVRQLRRPGERPLVRVDAVGDGQGLLAVLRTTTRLADGIFVDFPAELEVVGVYVTDEPTAVGFVRLRDQLWWSLRQWIHEGGEIPKDAKLDAELVAPTYEIDARGRIHVESKDSMRAKLGRSPDLADALALAVFEGKRSIADEILADKTVFPRARFAEDGPPTLQRLADVDDDIDEGRGWRGF